MTEEQGVTEPVAEVQQEQQQQVVSDKEINFKALREKTERLEQQNQMMQAELYRVQQQSQPQQKPQVEFADDDIPTWGELKQVRNKELEEVNRLKQELSDLKMRSRYQDYETTVREYLPDVLQEDPDLALAIQNNPMMHRLAYKLAQASPRYHQEKVIKQNESTVNKIVENATKPTPANVRKSVATHNEEAQISSMSDDQIMSMFQMAKARS